MKNGCAPFTTLPRALLAYPSIRLGDSEHLSPTQIAVVCALMVAARGAIANDLHRRALKGGKKAIDREVANSARYFENREFAGSMGIHYTKGKSIAEAGKAGYRRRKKAVRRLPPPETSKVRLSRYALLRRSGLSCNGTNLRALDEILDRLCCPVGCGGESLPGPLVEWAEVTKDSKTELDLTVRGEWLRPPYGLVPTPLPLRSAPAVSLWLFLHTVQTTPHNKVGIRLDALCRRLGIPTTWGPAAANRAIERALAIVNSHLARLDAEVLEKHKIKLPEMYEAVAMDDGRIRFAVVPRQVRPDDELDGRAPTPKRTRASAGISLDEFLGFLESADE